MTAAALRVTRIAQEEAVSIVTIATGVATITENYHAIAAQTGTTDDLDTITPSFGFTPTYVMITLLADTGDTITLKHGTGNITFADAADHNITATAPISLITNDGGTNWYGLKAVSASGDIPWASPGTIGSTTPNTGAFTQLTVNAAAADLDTAIGSDATANFFYIDAGNNRASFGGLTTPDGTLHVHTSTAGSVTAQANADDFVVEVGAAGGMSILTPDANEAKLAFGSPSDDDYAWMGAQYNAGAPFIRFVNNSTAIGRIQFDAKTMIMGANIAPDGTIHAHTASAGSVTAASVADDLIVENSASGGISILTPDAVAGRLYFGAPSNDDYAWMIAQYNSGTPYIQWGSDSTAKMRFDTSLGTLAVGQAGAGSAIIHSHQSSATGAIPPLYLQQADVDQDMIELNCTIGVGNAIEAVGAKTLTVTHFVKVTLTGVGDRYFSIGTIA